MDKLLIPEDNRLSIVILAGEQLAPQLNDIIANVYRNAVENNW